MKALLFANTDWYLYNFRLEFAEFLREQGWEVVFMSPQGEYAKLLQDAGFRWIGYDLSRKGTDPLAELKSVFAISRIYKHEKPDLVHHFTVKCDIYGSIAAKLNGIRSRVNSVTGLGYIFLSDGLRAKLLRGLVKALYRFALKGSEVVFENPDDRALFLELGLVPAEHAHAVHGTGVNIGLYHPCPEPEGDPLVLLPSRMLWDKGIGEFVEAAGIIRGKGIPARFVLVGKEDNGNPTGIAVEQLRAWADEGCVEWWGWQDDMPSVLAQAHIICLPSYREGLSKTLIEAAAAGKPIVATDVPGCRDVVRDGVNGRTVPARSAEALAEAIEELIRNRDLRIKMGKESRNLAETVFANDPVHREIYDVYRKAMKKA